MKSPAQDRRQHPPARAATERPAPELGEMLAPLRREKRLSDQVADLLIELISKGDLHPGDPLPSQYELARRLGVARNVVREAVHALAGRGIVKVQHGVGLTVADLQPSDAVDSLSRFVRGASSLGFVQVQEVRRGLEVDAAELAAARATDEDIALLRAAYERQLRFREDLEEEARADLEFHRVIAQATKNELFSVVMGALGESLLDLRRMAMRRSDTVGAGLKEHRSILEAVAARRPQLAREAMAAHFQTSWADFIEPEPASHLLEARGVTKGSQSTPERRTDGRPATRRSRGSSAAQRATRDRAEIRDPMRAAELTGESGTPTGRI